MVSDGIPYTEDGPEGEWFYFTLKEGVRQQCCGCGLVHDIKLRRKGTGRWQMRFVQHNRATSAARRNRRRWLGKRRVVIADED